MNNNIPRLPKTNSEIMTIELLGFIVGKINEFQKTRLSDFYINDKIKIVQDAILGASASVLSDNCKSIKEEHLNAFIGRCEEMFLSYTKLIRGENVNSSGSK